MKFSSCHPTTQHKAHGLCKKCYNKKRRATPEYKAKERAFQQSKERKAYMKAYDARPERIAKREEYRNSEHGKAVLKAIWKKPKHKESRKNWKLKNKCKWNSIVAKRKAAKLKRTPKWADLNKIEQIYKNCPKGFVVDHIIPLQGKEVSGLHVAYNLQYLTPQENSIKHNKLLDMYINLKVENV